MIRHAFLVLDLHQLLLASLCWRSLTLCFLTLLSHIYAIRGDADATFEWLERAYQQRDAGLTYVNALPFFDHIKSDPRWMPFLKKMGLDG